jgi:enoyl-CoA hydratase/carnithine racemase
MGSHQHIRIVARESVLVVHLERSAKRNAVNRDLRWGSRQP